MNLLRPYNGLIFKIQLERSLKVLIQVSPKNYSKPGKDSFSNLMIYYHTALSGAPLLDELALSYVPVCLTMLVL